MKHQKILNLVNEASDSKFVTRKWNIFNDNSNTSYGVRSEIIYNREVLKSNPCDYNDALVRGNITIIGHQVTQVAFKTCVLFAKCTTKTDGTTIDGADDLDLVMAMYNLIEYSSIFLKQEEIYGFIQKMKQLILMQILQTLIILSLSGIRLSY